MIACICANFLLNSYLIVEVNAEEKMIKDIKSITAAQWKSLAGKKIYFGHQSVGYNMIDGIRAVMAVHPEIQLNIIESRDLAAINEGVFSHSKVGKNKDAASKTDEFVGIIEAANGKIDIAFLKYCYVDADATVDVPEVFAYYKERLNYLQKKYPNTNLVHITMPLTTVQTGLKPLVKKILGKPIRDVEANVKRNEFNRLLNSEYKGKASVFDIAAVEASRPDGKMVTFEKDGVAYLALYQGYSNDGGHLNDQGQKIVAEQLLVFLAGLNGLN